MAARTLRGWRRSIALYLFCGQAIPLWILFATALFEVWSHSQLLIVRVPQNERDWDKPFATSCQNVTANAEGQRENAAFVMLTRNSDLENALHSVQSIERHFNKWFHYPIIFLNDEPWGEDFMLAMRETVSGQAQFEVIPEDLWGFPDHIDKSEALASIKAQGQLGEYSRANKAGIESYHHMCRFFSGLPVLKPYKWYWRIEPDIDLYCDLTYDPFVEMAKRGKAYGYTIAIQETTATCPTLFRHASEYKENHHFNTTEGWKAIMSPSWLPWPFRALASSWRNHDRAGDTWNRCHYWSNFEIANLDFFRSRQYQHFYQTLDRKEGFYYERVGHPCRQRSFLTCRSLTDKPVG
nr:o-glycoside alpha-1,2-mannosyltransferase like 4 [Quercus suber]